MQKILLSVLLSIIYLHCVSQVPPPKKSRANRDPGSGLYRGTGSITTDGKWGMKDTGAKGEARAMYRQNGKYGFVLPDGTRLDPIYDEIQFIADGAIVKKDRLYALTDINGKLITGLEYNSVKNTSYNNSTYFVVEKGNK